MFVTGCEKEVEHYVTKSHILRSFKLNCTQLFFALSSIYLVSSAILEQFETVDQAVDFIASAPCLEDIQFWSVSSSVGYSESSNYSSQAIGPPLRQISFDSDPLLDNIMDWFCRCHPTPSVHTLEIIHISTGDNIYNFIRYLGSDLENLAIPAYDWMEEVWSKCISDRYFISLITLSDAPPIDLSQNISLRNIFFTLKFWQLPSPSSFDWIISIVSSIAHPSLETVTITMSVIYIIWRTGALEQLSASLSALDALFMKQPLSTNSTKLCFRIDNNHEVVRAAVEDGLPKLDGKKRLVFDV
jgi:hypothetical protein